MKQEIEEVKVKREWLKTHCRKEVDMVSKITGEVTKLRQDLKYVKSSTNEDIKIMKLHYVNQFISILELATKFDKTQAQLA